MSATQPTAHQTAFSPRKIRLPRLLAVLLRETAFYIALLAATVFSVFPVFWLVLTAFRPTVDLFSFTPRWIPQRFTLDHFRAVFQSIALETYLQNTIIISLSVTAISVIVGFLAGYVLARRTFPGKTVISGALLVARMLPIITALVPVFLIVSSVRMLDTYTALIVTHVAFKLPVTIWLMQGFVASIPIDLEEAAQLDGCTQAQMLTRVIFPLILPGIAAAAIIAFLFTWNDLVIALVLASTQRTQPMSVGLTNFFMEHGIDWGPMAAAAVIMLVPAFCFAFFAQRYLIAGLTSGAVKG